MNNVEFYSRYYQIEAEYSKLNKEKVVENTISTQIKQNELSKEMNVLFDERMGGKINILV